MSASPIDTLSTEQQHLSVLIALMEQEQQLLVTLNVDALAELTPQKNALLAELTAQSIQRYTTLSAAGFDGEEAGMAKWVESHPEQDAGAAWNALLALAAQAKELNRVNGLLINKQLANNQTILNALRTPTQGEAGTMYGASGQTVSSGVSKRYVVG